jgi:hypothetical protein
MVAVPAATALTIPEGDTVAMEALLLDQVPPVTESVKETVPVPQMREAPEIVPAESELITVTVAFAVVVPQLPVTVYVSVVVPAATPVTAPVAEIVAMEVLPDTQVPEVDPVVAYDVVEPTQTGLMPEIAPAVAFGVTVILYAAVEVPQLFVTV